MLQSTRLSLRTVLLSSLLAATLPATAQSGRDPADITRGRQDPAAVGVGQSQRQGGQSSAAETARFMRSIGARWVEEGEPASPPPSAESVQTLQELLYTARELGGSRYDVNGRQRAGIDALRRDMDRVAKQVWPHLSAQSQERYRQAIDQIKRLDELTETDIDDVDAYRARGGALGMLRETETTLRSLEDAIAPMLDDVRGKLQQQASPRYGR